MPPGETGGGGAGAGYPAPGGPGGAYAPAPPGAIAGGGPTALGRAPAKPVGLPHMLHAASASLHIHPQLGQGLSAIFGA